jgi:hypothetical protein
MELWKSLFVGWIFFGMSSGCSTSSGSSPQLQDGSVDGVNEGSLAETANGEDVGEAPPFSSVCIDPSECVVLGKTTCCATVQLPTITTGCFSRPCATDEWTLCASNADCPDASPCVLSPTGVGMICALGMTDAGSSGCTTVDTRDAGGGQGGCFLLDASDSAAADAM